MTVQSGEGSREMLLLSTTISREATARRVLVSNFGDCFIKLPQALGFLTNIITNVGKDL